MEIMDFSYNIIVLTKKEIILTNTVHPEDTLYLVKSLR